MARTVYWSSQRNIQVEAKLTKPELYKLIYALNDEENYTNFTCKIMGTLYSDVFIPSRVECN